MTLRYKDYYSILGVARDADAGSIKRAFRERAKAFHPDRRPDHPDADERFREINEAYAVLGDMARRASYDGLGSGRHEGEPLNGGDGGGREEPRARGDFSEFFNFLSRKSGRAASGRATARQAESGDLEAEISITLEEALGGVTRNLTLTVTESAAFGRARNEERKLEVKIPAGIRDGQRLRIKGKRAGFGRGDDLFLRVRIEPHDRFRIEGSDLHTDLRVSPWEAALGATIRVPTVDGVARIRIPPGSTSGQRMRLKGEGFPEFSNESAGDLVYRLMISLPERLTPEERQLMEELADISDYDPRR
jgi:curved DNA-binding protein